MCQSNLLCAVQNHRAKVVAVKQAGTCERKVAAQLPMKALAEKNVPFNFVTSKYFQAYVALRFGLDIQVPLALHPRRVSGADQRDHRN
jgi:hypothetical protein